MSETRPDIRALIFDMDGVIVDSNPVHRLAWEAYNRRYGVETTEAMHQLMYGRRNEQIIREFLGHHLSDDDVRAHSEAKEALYREMIGPSLETALVPGVREFLAMQGDFGLAMATNANAANTAFLLGETGLAGRFDVVIHGGDVAHPKPHPQIYLRAAYLLGVSPGSCVVFEDSYAGVEAGLAAGMRVVGLTTTHAELPGVSLLIPSFSHPALAEWLSEQRAAQPPGLRRIGLRPQVQPSQRS